MKTSKLRATGLCEGNAPVTGEFPAQRASDAENVSIWWRHHNEYTHRRRSIASHPWANMEKKWRRYKEFCLYYVQYVSALCRIASYLWWIGAWKTNLLSTVLITKLFVEHLP